MLRVAALALSCTVADAFSMAAPRAAAVVAHRGAAPAMLLDQIDLPAATTLLSELVDADGERIYGAVDAPNWVAPVGGVLAILTALLPVLLAPGDEALERQRGDEAAVASKQRGQIFGTGRKD